MQEFHVSVSERLEGKVVRGSSDLAAGKLRLSSSEAKAGWAREDELIHHRLQWLCVIQGLLFAAYGISLQVFEKVLDAAKSLTEKADGKAAPEAVHVLTELRRVETSIKLFQEIVAGAGVWISILVFAGVLAACMAMVLLKHKGRITYGVHPVTTFLGLICALGVPLVFTFVWLRIIDRKLFPFMYDTARSALGHLW